MNTGHTLTTEQYVDKCKRKQSIYLEDGYLTKARSMQFKIDNAIGVIGNKGRIPFHLLPIAEKFPNRKTRRIPVQGKPKTAKDQIKIDSQVQALDPSKVISAKERATAEQAARDLYSFVKSDLTWGSKVDNDDTIIIYSKEKIDLPAKHRGFLVKNLVGDLPESKV